MRSRQGKRKNFKKVLSFRCYWWERPPVGYMKSWGDNTTVKLLLLYSDVHNATKPQIGKSQNRKSHGSAKFCFASVGNDISVTHSAQAEEAAGQLRKGARREEEQPVRNSPAPQRRTHLHIYVPVPSFSNEKHMLYLAQIFSHDTF